MTKFQKYINEKQEHISYDIEYYDSDADITTKYYGTLEYSDKEEGSFPAEFWILNVGDKLPYKEDGESMYMKEVAKLLKKYRIIHFLVHSNWRQIEHFEKMVKKYIPVYVKSDSINSQGLTTSEEMAARNGNLRFGGLTFPSFIKKGHKRKTNLKSLERAAKDEGYWKEFQKEIEKYRK
jgi:hypothetical protein